MVSGGSGHVPAPFRRSGWSPHSMKQHGLWALIGHRNRKQHIKYIWYHKVIWRFPKMGEPPKSSNFNRLFHYEPAVGVPPSAPVPAPREGPIALQLLWPTTCLPASGQQKRWKRWDFEGPSLGTSHFMRSFRWQNSGFSVDHGILVTWVLNTSKRPWNQWLVPLIPTIDHFRDHPNDNDFMV